AHLRLALTRAADAARQAVAHPVEGTVLTVAAAASEAAAGEESDLRTVVHAAYDGALAALAKTPEQLAVLGRAGVVDAGGRGLVAVLGALVETVTGQAPVRGPRTAHGKAPTPVDGGSVVGLPVGEGPLDCPEDGVAGPAFEVIYLLEAGDEQVARLRTRLDALGDSLVVVGGDGLWHVHVHVDDAGAAVEAGVEAGRPYRIRITHFATESGHDLRVQAEPAQRAVVVVVPGDGLAGLCTEAGATTVIARPGEPPASGELVDAIRRAHAREVVLLPNDAALRHTAAAAAEQARTEGVRVALVPTRAAVQGIAALAVHEPDRGFDEDVVAMTAAAGATRYAELAVAERQSWTMAGICQAGDILGLIDGDVAVIGADVPATARTVLDRMLAAGGELVTLVLGEDVPDSLADALEEHVREGHLAVDTVIYRGGHQRAPLLIGVE
ncbi:DAK2 domain-containing protein, partial [Streptomyces sp. wa1063]|uniref:DAK2 domain-containing protein n=1 Tax=Streptomyces sp. wa1063 TaxID=1828212 RepID=UPI000D1CD7AF